MNLRAKLGRLVPLAAVLCLGIAVAAEAQIRLEDFDQQLGPFDLNGQRFTVVLHKKRAAGGGDPETQETLARLELRDAAGTMHYEQSLPFRLAGPSFQYTIDASAEVLQGRQAKGLLVSYGTLPSPPLGGQAWQVFGLFDGKLVPFSKPLLFDGQLALEKTAKGIIKTSDEPNFQPEVLRAKVWSGNFFLLVPLRVDWLPGKMSLAWRCVKSTPQGPRAMCEYPVEAERVPAEESPTFVRLFPEPDAGFNPAHIVLTNESKVEFLAAEAEVLWQEDAEEATLRVGDDPWLNVRIDGQEGWIHTYEDYSAIGLPLTN